MRMDAETLKVLIENLGVGHGIESYFGFLLLLTALRILLVKLRSDQAFTILDRLLGIGWLALLLWKGPEVLPQAIQALQQVSDGMASQMEGRTGAPAGIAGAPESWCKQTLDIYLRNRNFFTAIPLELKEKHCDLYGRQYAIW